MTTIYIVGPNGMLGRALVEESRNFLKPGWSQRIITRAETSLFLRGEMFPLESNAIVINAAGIVKGRDDKPLEYIWSNAMLPHRLADHPAVERIVQVSTDCVFDGKKNGRYHVYDGPSPTDLYSYSKLAGELQDYDNALTVRTSFIGFGERGLMRWLLDQPENAVVPGYTNWNWNGFYVRTLARLLLVLATEAKDTGLMHLAGHHITKYDLLNMTAKLLRPDITIVATEHKDRRNMILDSYALGDYEPPPWNEQLAEMLSDWNAPKADHEHDRKESNSDAIRRD